MASRLEKSGSIEEAKGHFGPTLAISEAGLGQNHPQVASVLNRLGELQEQESDFIGARTSYERALQIYQGVDGHHSIAVAAALANVSRMFERTGTLGNDRSALEKALEGYTRAHEIEQDIFGIRHEKIAIRKHDIGRVLLKLGSRLEARKQLREALRVSTVTVGAGHQQTVAIRATIRRMVNWKTS